MVTFQGMRAADDGWRTPPKRAGRRSVHLHCSEQTVEARLTLEAAHEIQRPRGCRGRQHPRGECGELRLDLLCRHRMLEMPERPATLCAMHRAVFEFYLDPARQFPRRPG